MSLVNPLLKPARLMYLLLLPVLCFYPTASALADTVAPDSTDQTTSTAPAEETPVPQAPAEAPTETAPTVTEQPAAEPTPPAPEEDRSYTYNESTGLWENGYYTWNPNTYQTAPKNAPTYSYNPSTGMWDTTEWVYDPSTSQYVPNVTSSSAAPESTELAALGLNPDSLGLINPNDPVLLNSDANSAFNLFYNAQISNLITSSAISGNASVIQNTIGGNALSGNAQALANIINLLQSSWSPATSGQIATFINNIDGNVIGDIVIDPSQIPTPHLTVAQTQPGSNLTVNSSANTAINNDIDLAAYSGDATVSLNTEAGNATTGEANAMANIINMINSAISAGNSFVGTININGNLDGDILLPPDVLNNLLTSSSVPKTTIDTANLENGSLLANLNNNQIINNQVNTDANSGNASVVSNTTAGNATTGNANTNITLLNLTGQQVVGDNALLVFVNVMGQWVGMIMNAPAGTTAAGIGGNVTQGPCNCFEDTEINSDNTQTINNNINVAAGSGDATVSHNTLAGNATSGDASAGVNLANLINSSFSLSNWFGVLFINVFGSWIGSFGVDTAAGNNPIITQAEVQNIVSDPSKVQVFSFVANGSGANSSHKIVPVDLSQEQNDTESNNAVLASAAKKGSTKPTDQKDTSSTGNSWIKLSGLSLLVGASLMGVSRLSRKES